MDTNDMVNNPPHYKQYSFEVIELTKHFPFCEGNAIKYIMRAPFKGSFEEDLDKAAWYLDYAEKMLRTDRMSELAHFSAYKLIDELDRDDISHHAYAALLCIVHSIKNEHLLSVARREILLWKEKCREQYSKKSNQPTMHT